jgi:hypothetical protein
MTKEREVTTQPATGYWWYDHTEISRLLRWLDDNGGIDVRDCIGIVEKPWHWDAEYEEMCREQAGAAAKRDSAIDAAEFRSEVAEYEDP